MSLLKDMKTLIPASAASQSAIFSGDYPDSPNNLVALYQTGGKNPAHSYEKRQFENPSFQVRVRNASYAAMITAAEAIKDALDGQVELTINGNRYLSIFQSSDILAHGKDGKNRSVCTLNFDVKVDRA